MQKVISRHGMLGSMGRVGACGDCQSVLTGSMLVPGVLAATV